MPKCSECGYLAVRDEYNSLVGEADEFCRTRGSHKSSIGRATPANLFCFMENVAFPPREHIPEEIVKRISGDHPCSQFTKWRPGRSPQQEEDMEALREVKRLDAERREEQRKWNEKTEANIERRHNEQMAWNARQLEWNKEAEKKIQRRHLSNYLLQALLTSVIVVVTLACYQLIPWPWNTRPLPEPSANAAK